MSAPTVIHAEDQFPQDPEAVAAAASDRLRIARSTRDAVARIENGETDWQRSVEAKLAEISRGILTISEGQLLLAKQMAKLDTNLTLVTEFCRGRVAAFNQAESVLPLPSVKCFEDK